MFENINYFILNTSFISLSLAVAVAIVLIAAGICGYFESKGKK